MKHWQCIAMLDMDELPTLARHAEDLGFEGVSLGEHLITFSEQYEDYAYSKNNMIRWYPETHWPDPWVQIAALAQVTERLRFLTSVYVLPLHTPFDVAKSISTAANISRGRVILGAGIGWQKSEFELVGQDFHTRGRRCDEMLEVMQKLWSGEPVSHQGEFYRFPSLQMSPGLAEPLPIYIGGFSEAAIKRAARHDGWIGGQHEMAEVEALVPQLLAERSRQGRADDPFDICLGLYDPSPENIARCEALGVSKLYREAFCDANGMASRMTLEEKLRDMEAFASRHLT
ncbi:LLM class oxidoreductase [Haliea atlantica]|nr:LLM class F420-dependent oxidoreductase [Haliea sp.]MAL96652.1 LLM class F420-dependent oxidoreductase [Haliea sp.]|tara:strand:- start:560 stop:1420 length:861 start_codon:yes stop_codon:yes gene_type:complete